MGGGGGDALDRLLDERLRGGEQAGARFLGGLLGTGPGISAVVHYGSCLVGTAAIDSEPDFYLVVDSMAAWTAGRPRERLFAGMLPPLTVHHRLPDGTSCKVCVVAREELRRETSPAASDLHHLGRFSKRVAILWARDEAARALVRDAQRSALHTVAGHALALLPARFTLDAFLRELLGLSYRGEPRIAEPGKVARLLAADRDGYRAIGRLLLAARGLAADGDLFAQPAPSGEARQEALRLIARSRRRALLRWPKNIVTFDGWADYAIRKVERNTGRALVLSPRARRFPLLFGWGAFFALRRSGVVR